MKIATITVFCNERFRVPKWKEYYEGYKADIYLHVIVNNGDPEDTSYLKEEFPESLILTCPTNNLLAAYNMGLAEVLKDDSVDAISQITNDIKLSDHAFLLLYKKLYENDKLAMVSPILLNKDSEYIDLMGAEINFNTLFFRHIHIGEKISDVKEDFVICTGLPAGIFLSKRGFYEKHGFQDETIFMYSDEVDMGIKAQKSGLKMACYKDICAWHQHENRPGTNSRSPLSSYFSGRNPIFIAKKYHQRKQIICTELYHIQRSITLFLACIIHHKSREYYIDAYAFFKGTIAGILNNMDNQNIKI